MNTPTHKSNSRAQAESGAPARESVFSGRDRFMYGGEVAYFRLDPDRWAGALASLRRAHMDTVSVYVPWNWHEISANSFDFDGRSHPRRNLARFLDLCVQADLGIHVRPGPWIQGEWLHGGIPDWLLRSHPEILALDSAGRATSLEIMVPAVSYLHPYFLARCDRWLRSLTPLINGYASHIVAIQLDDELHYSGGVRSGDPLLLDYNEVVVGANGSSGFYQTWLADRYQDIAALNAAYGARYDRFPDVQPPRRLPSSNTDLAWFLDWHYCKEAIANTYTERLHDIVVDEGVRAPLTMVQPYMTPYGAERFSDHFLERKKPILVTTEAYPTLWAAGAFPEWAAGHVAAMTQVARRWNAPGQPLVSAETQSAMGYHLTPEAMEAFYALMIGQGLAGLSLYMMVGGDNPSPWGMNTGRSYDLGAPVGHDLSVRPHFETVARLGEYLETHGKDLLRTDPLLDLAVGYYPPYETAAQQGDTRSFGTRHRYDEVLGQVFGLAATGVAHPAGVLSLLTSAGYAYGMQDLERATLRELQAFRQLWCLGLDFMSRDVQTKLLAYMEAGGHLVILPQVPHLGDDLRPEPLLQNRIGAPVLDAQTSAPVGAHRLPWHLITCGSVDGLPVSDVVDHFDLGAVPDAVQIAHNERTGLPCGYTITVGEGTATVLGFKPRFGWDMHATHRSLIRDLVGRVGIVASARAEGSELLVAERVAADTAFLFVVNATPWPQGGRIVYHDPVTKESVSIPRLIDELVLPRQGGLILRVQAVLPGSDIRLLYSTSQVQSWSASEGRAELVVYGPAGTLGEAAFGLSTRATVTIDGAPPLQATATDSETTVTYRHSSSVTRIVLEG